MERRERQKLNRKQCSSLETPSPTHQKKSTVDSVKLELQSNSWLRIRLSAKDKEKVFTNLFCHFNVVNFRAAFRALDGSKAIGIDNITKVEHGENLEENLEDLTKRLHTGTYRPQPKREVLIPKANGKMRPIVIAAFEDELVEWMAREILSSPL